MGHMDSTPKASLLVESRPELGSVAEELAKDDFARLFETPRAGDIFNNNLVEDF